MVFGADSIPIVPIYVNFCENNEKLIIAWQVHDVTTYSLINISINIPHFAEFHILPTSRERNAENICEIKNAGNIIV